MMRNHPVKLLALTAATLIGVACSDNTNPSNSQPETANGSAKVYDAAWFAATAKPKFTSEGGATPFRTANTIPYWSSSFVGTNGVTYPYTMVGTNPDAGNVSTSVPTVIIPFKFVFADGSVMDGTGDVAELIASPIFTDYAYTEFSGGDNTQYGDAIYRAQWNKIGTAYHVRLGQPTVLPTQTIKVPANQGFNIAIPGRPVALMDYYWFAPQLRNAISSLHVPASTFPMILTHNTLLYQGIEDNCCIIGYHGADGSRNGNGAQQVPTYMFSAMITPGTFGNPSLPRRGLSDIHAFSHEVSEWYDDPFVNNFVQPWQDDEFAPQYGCTSILETGDPVVGVWFSLPGNTYQAGAGGVWHPEDEVHFSFFSRENPSRAYQQRYTYMGTFDHPAHDCT
jgi:hypothetical protein